jgi:Class III cytochrome C family.
MKTRLVIILAFIALTATCYLFPRTVLNANPQTSGQDRRRKTPARKSAQTQRRGKPAKDYSAFSHRSAKHKSLDCDACHKAPTANWPTASGFPDVADYPAHASCTNCHRTEFFKGARPVICSICHTKVSPRDGARFVFDKPNQPTQFETIFPHDKHQDVIARLKGFDKNFESAHASLAQEKSIQKYNNCAICHETETATLQPAGGFPDNFPPPPGTFKNAPTSHASCFNCHWKNQKPTHNECAGCHDLSPTDVATLSAPKRISLKFSHATEQHIDECTKCHINITKVSSLRGLKADVPLSACVACHNKAGLRTDLDNELEQLDKNRGFNCAYCHTSDKGLLDAPASHYRIAGREPLQRKDIK